MLRYRRYIVLIVLSLCLIEVQAQERDSIMPGYKHTVYLEVLGSGGYGSLNYEHAFFGKGMLGLHARAGISTYKLRDFELKFNPDIIIPVSASIIYGRVHSIEAGIGQTFSSVSQINIEQFIPERKNRLSATGILAYRVTFRKPSMVLRFAYTPIWEFYDTWQHWGGLSIGYSF